MRKLRGSAGGGRAEDGFGVGGWTAGPAQSLPGGRPLGLAPRAWGETRCGACGSSHTVSLHRQLSMWV